MLNELNGMSVESAFAPDYFSELSAAASDNTEELRNHPSFEKGYDMATDGERQDKPYTINSKDPIHLRAFALGYNEGLEDIA